MITKDMLKKYANLLMFDMSDDEYQTLEEEFEIILKQMDLIGEINGINKVKPMFFPFPIPNINYRNDEKINNLAVTDVLKNASEVESNQVKVPKVVE